MIFATILLYNIMSDDLDGMVDHCPAEMQEVRVRSRSDTNVCMMCTIYSGSECSDAIVLVVSDIYDTGHSSVGSELCRF